MTWNYVARALATYYVPLPLRPAYTPKDAAEKINTSITVSTVVLEICSDPSLPLHQRQSDSQDEPGDARLLRREHMTRLVVRSHQDPPQLQ
jgi:hypothetical protein